MAPHPSRVRRRLGIACAALVLVSACGGQNSTETIDVFAAASLTAALGEIADKYEAANQGVTVRLNFAGSSTLATQISNGAEADVFASADEANMRKVVDTVAVSGEPRYFATNELTILVAAGNPRGIHALADLTRPDLTVAACAPEVPAGRYAREAFANAGLAFPESSQELDVKQVVSRVALGEADAGIGYITDAAGEERVTTVAIPPEHNVIARYPAVGLTEAGRPFLDFLLGDAAQGILREQGFAAPT